MSSRNEAASRPFALSAVAAGVMLAFGTVAPQAAVAQDEEATELGTLQITGSRIKRSDVEGALPITVIERADLELSGYSTAADYLRSLPFNSFGSIRPQSGSSAQGDATINLRGLGADRTLVLINGRRMPKSPTTGSTQNLNNIPMGAIERIEILSDGASAVYGSDAIGGVINVILRKDFKGVEIMYGAATPSIPKNGGDREEGYVTFGAGDSRTSILAGVSWNTRDIVFARDYPWYSPGASIYSNNYSTTGAITDWTVLPGACESDTGRSPGTFYELPSGSSLTGTRCGYNFALVSADEASYNTESAYARAQHELNSNWDIYTDFWYSKTDSFGRYAPVPDSNFFYGSPLDGDSPNNPTNPTSSMYDTNSGLADNTPVYIWHRFDSLGNRDNEVENTLTDLTVGTQGRVGMFDLDFGVRTTRNKTFDIGRNYLLGTRAFELINSGEYDLLRPTENDPDLLNSIKVTISRISIYDQKEAYGSVSWSMFETGAGQVQWAAGAEYRKEDYGDQYDSLSESGSVGGSAGNSAGGSRSVKAFFVESLVPVLENLEVTVAGRFDDYSDYGDDFSPKVALRFQPTDEITLRASYSEGFRAPTLDILTQADSFSADSVSDPQTCQNAGEAPDCDFQINGLRTANPNLDSEKSKQLSLGVAFAPLSWFNGTADFWDTTIDNRINFFDAQELVDREQAGDPIPTGLGVERNASGTITRVVQGYGNEGTIDISGIDINLRTQFDLFGGVINNSLMTSYLLDYSENGGRDQVKDPGQPQYRSVLSNTFTINAISFGWNTNLIGSTADEVTAGKQEGHVPTWITHDLQATYSGSWGGRITVGALNVLEKKPPIGKGFTDGRDYDFNLYSGDGRIAYFRYTHSF